jgi:predicted nucleic acid-binding protein
MSLDDALGIEADSGEVLGDRIADVLGPEVLRTALASGLTAYDAEFVVLARALGVPLVTADRTVLAAAADVAVSLESF